MDELIKAEFDRFRDEEERQNHRIGQMEEKIEKLNEISLAIRELTINMSHMLNTQNEMRDDLEVIKAAPAANWDKTKWLIITGIISAVLGYVLKTIGI